MPKGMPKILLSDWIKTVENKNKPIMVYDHTGRPFIARANLKSFKSWFSAKTMIHGALANRYVHKVFDIPDDSYQVYLAE